MPERRPPKTKALIGTPLGSSQSGSSAGFCVAGAVKRALGCDALVVRLRRPVVALPVDGVRRRVTVHALPPHVAVVGQGDVGEDGVGPDRLHRRRVGRVRRSGRDAEVPGFRVDRVQLAVGARLDPGDVVADGGHLPALVGERRRRDEHGEVRLAARARERRGDERLVALRVGDAHDQHVLGEPALVAGHRRGDAQGQALLAEQGVAAVAAAVAPDRALLGEVHDVLDVGVARPRHVLLARGQGRADGVHARHERPVGAEHLDRLATHPGHDLHVHRDVGRVGDLDPQLGDRANRADPC